MARSILGPVTIHIWEPDNASSFKHNQAINLSINANESKIEVICEDCNKYKMDNIDFSQ